ncbi:MAG TPA: hypothetical protein PLV21_11550 [Cyclobacteriaceae bacterium]|nr:hypothetical protein [Cyclobacteriaceae bacterium]HRJ82516.1 hypothetical protein [Cyclobacteriaceae bacterium]
MKRIAFGLSFFLFYETIRQRDSLAKATEGLSDLKVTHQRSPIVAGADFYPFGLCWSSPAAFVGVIHQQNCAQRG